MKTLGTKRLSYISIDTGLSIQEAEQELRSGNVRFDKITSKYQIVTMNRNQYDVYPDAIDRIETIP